ncbi:MAG: zinc finger-like domain-containing protein [Chitinophagaceae bacterium]|nr:zinc finger-like domain-containing protein [Chitinophagaceae bacterium]
MKKIILVILTMLTVVCGFAQKQTFDVVSYSVSSGWQQQQYEGGVQLSVTDKNTGGYFVAIITKSMKSSSSANENFNTNWESLVKTTVQVNGEPTMQEPAKDNGWDIISGGANYTDGDNTGMATLLTATGGGQTVSVVIMLNSKQYENDMTSFLNSLELSKAPSSSSENTTSNTNNNSSSPLVGLWCDNHLETSGYANGYPQYSAGYYRREYLFNENGTYFFRAKNWSTLLKEILFVYETGTYTLQGNRITITPQNGSGEWWSKKNNNPNLWGSRLKSSSYKPEKTTYTFEVKYYSGSNGYALLLDPRKTTERDGTYNNPTSFSYQKMEDGVSKIDNPPGFKTGFEIKTNGKITNASTSTNTSSNTQKSNTQSSNKSKRCTSCSGGYNLCTLCGGTGRTWQQQQRYNPVTKQYEYTRELAPCTFCGGKGRIRCKVCNGTGFIN